MEWLFLTCYNYWIICHLVRSDDGKAFIAYSPMFSIEDSSKPFQAFLGAILSVKNQVPVQTSIFNPDMELDDILEEEDTGNILLPDVIDNSLGDSSRTTVLSQASVTCSHLSTSQVIEPGIKVCAIPGHFFVSWLTDLFADYFLLPTLSRILSSIGATSATTTHLELTCSPTSF